MPRRIEVELTSARGDGGYTWRAAGAREPRGIVDAELVPEGAKVGDVMRAEADFDIDGVTIVSMAPKSDKKRNEAERIEILGRPQRDDQLVTSTLAARPSGRDSGPRDRRDRRDRKPREGEGGRDRRDRPDRGERSDRGERKPRTAERRPPRPRPEEPPKPKPKRLRPSRVHRNAVLADLPPEHRPIAEQVLAGDIPAVRTAIEKENASRKESGQPQINGDELLKLAEQMRPRLRTAEWHDRADSALADIEEIDLRDLRSVVVAADSAARDDETRALATQLRDGLTRRVESEQAAWLADLTSALDAGRVVRALRLSSRPPKAGTILEPALTSRLAEGASASLTSDAPDDRWAAVLDATAHSPVRLTVAPASVPEKPSDELLASVRKLGGRVPQVAVALGVEVETAPTRPPRGAKRKPPPPPPPPPPPVATASAEPAPEPAAETAETPEPAAAPQAGPPEVAEVPEPSVEEGEQVEGSAQDDVASES
jgi:hypothetical protein